MTAPDFNTLFFLCSVLVLIVFVMEAKEYFKRKFDQPEENIEIAEKTEESGDHREAYLRLRGEMSPEEFSALFEGLVLCSGNVESKQNFCRMVYEWEKEASGDVDGMILNRQVNGKFTKLFII